MLMRQRWFGRWKGEETMSNIISDFKDELSESAKDMVKIAKKQVAGGDQIKDKKTDPVTGKPIPSKKMVTQQAQQTAQIAQMRMKKVREELEKQRLKVTAAPVGTPAGQAGPEIKQEQPKQDDAVQKALKASKSTGEFKGLIGG